MIEEGTYRARAVEAALGYTSNDTEQVAIDFELLDEELAGKHITWYGYFTDKTLETTLKSLRTCGWQSDDLSDLSGIDANEVFVVVAHEEDQEGNLRARVRWVNSSGGGLALKTRMDEGAAKAFAERMRGHVLAQKSRPMGSPAAAPPAKPAANGGGTKGGARRAPTRSAAPDDDNIPF